MNRLELASARLSARILQRASSLVTYTRGLIVVSDIPAVIGQTTFAFVNYQGMDERVRSRDYIIKKSDLGAIDKPARGDQITFVDNGILVTCEVLPPNDEPEYRHIDGFFEIYRIHTKIVKEESV